MKIRVSASIEKETDLILDKIMQTGKYRNKSHAIEKAIEVLLEKEETEKKNKWRWKNKNKQTNMKKQNTKTTQTSITRIFMEKRGKKIVLKPFFFFIIGICGGLI